MKNSGIEWIGEIPDSWELVRFKDICSNKKEDVVHLPFNSNIPLSSSTTLHSVKSLKKPYPL